MLQSGYPNDFKKIKLLLIIFSKMNQNDRNSKSYNTENYYVYIVSYININKYSLEFDPIYENGKNIMHYDTIIIIYILMFLNYNYQ